MSFGKENRIETPLARANGLGSAHHASGHWMHQRITAIANIPLMLWLVGSMVGLTKAGFSYGLFTIWLAMPINSILMVLAVISVFYHAALGLTVVTEDYVHHEGLKMAKLIGIKLFFIAGAVACIFSVLKISVGTN